MELFQKIELQLIYQIKSQQLKLLQNQEDPSIMDSIKQLQVEINLLLNQKNMKWRQRAKRHWYKEGDEKN